MWLIRCSLTERDELNERPIFLRSTFLILGLAQAILHLYEDHAIEKIRLDYTFGSRSREFPTAEDFFKQEISKTLLFSARKAAMICLSSMVLYVLFLRQIAWYWSLWLARLVWDVSKSSEPPTMPPYHYTVLFRAFTSNIWLMCLWEVSNLAFSAYVAQSPLKRGKPITSDSQDPNGTKPDGKPYMLSTIERKDLPGLRSIGFVCRSLRKLIRISSTKRRHLRR